MAEWVRRVHEAVKRSGAHRELAIRIPSSIEDCLAAGLDPQAWIDEGIVDVLIGESSGGSALLNPMADFRPLVAAAKGSQCRVHAAIYSKVDSGRLGEAPIEIIRAAACNYWAQGIDGLYLAQWFGNWPYQSSFYEKLRELPHPDVMAPKDKHYYVPTTTGRYPRPSRHPEETTSPPINMRVGEPATVKFMVSDDLPRWERTGRVHEVLLRVRVTHTTELDCLSFSLNGTELPGALLRRINQMYRMTAPRYRTGSGYWFIFKLDREHWPVQGQNSLEVTLIERDPDVTPGVFLRDVELEIKYLMGKSFHRGEDPDLGPSEGGSVL